jgi:hypothetical protein
MRQVREILRLRYEQHLPHRAIARACGVGVGTMGAYCHRAQQAGLTWPLPAEWDDAQLEARQLFRRVGDVGGVPRPLPDMAWLHQELKRPGGHPAPPASGIPGPAPRRPPLQPVLPALRALGPHPEAHHASSAPRRREGLRGLLGQAAHDHQPRHGRDHCGRVVRGRPRREQQRVRGGLSIPGVDRVDHRSCADGGVLRWRPPRSSSPTMC